MKLQAAQKEKTSSVVKKFVTLGLGKEKYGIEVSRTREIIARYDIVPLPKTPDFIEGMISLRGDIIPIVDLRKRFSLQSRQRDSDTRIIVVELHDFTVGIQVDKVFEVLKLAAEDIEPPPPLVSGLKADYLEGVAEVKNVLITILNLNEIFSSSEKLVLSGLEDSEHVHEIAAKKEEKSRPAEAAPAPELKAEVKHQASETKSIRVTPDGMLEFRGKAYFLGKKYGGADAAVTESGGRLSVSIGGSLVKEFDV